MERLEVKTVKGNKYYYYSEWGWKDGKCRRLWQKYLGTLETIVRAVDGCAPAESAKVFEYGLVAALWEECQRQEVVQAVDTIRPKRRQGLSVGQYMAIAAINRADDPASKRGIWDWFVDTPLRRVFPDATAQTLSSQRFWDHMDAISESDARAAWSVISSGAMRRENIDLSQVSYDGTNFYTFISTFNERCGVAKRGKNKQGRSNLRQVSYALFCARDGNIPLFYDVYEGNMADAKQFPLMINRFKEFLGSQPGLVSAKPDVTVVFDKGNNSDENIRLLDELQIEFVGSLKSSATPDLADISSSSAEFIPCVSGNLEGVKYISRKINLHGKERHVVLTHGAELFRTQWLTLNNDIERAMLELDTLKRRLDDRAKGLIKGGKPPTEASVNSACKEILSRQYVARILKYTVSKAPTPTIKYELDASELERVANTALGKKILFSTRLDWHPEKVIDAYHGQYVIEHTFKEMKSRDTGSWWPLSHWTDQKINIHGFYCTVAILLKSLLHRRARLAGLDISMRRMLDELTGIKEVLLIGKKKKGGSVSLQRTVLTQTSELQDSLLNLFSIGKQKNDT